MAKTFGEELKRWRRALGLTQEEAAAELGVNLRSLQNWEIDRFRRTFQEDLVRRAMRQIAAEHKQQKHERRASA